MRLYEIQTNIRTLLDNLTEEDGELAEDVLNDLDKLQEELTIKADNIARYMRELQADAEGYGAEAARLSELAATATSKADRLKSYLHDTLKTLDIKKLDTEFFKFSVCLNSQPSVILEEGSVIPPAFQRVKVELDKTAVAKAYKNNEYIPPTIRVEQMTHLRIK